MSDTPDVRPGQVWADNDGRHEGRTIRVESIDGDRALCVVLTDDDMARGARAQCPHQARATSHDCRGKDGQWRWCQRPTVGKQTRIALRRFRPTSTGYRLVADAEVSR